MVINYRGRHEREQVTKKLETKFKMLNILDFSERRLVTLNQEHVR